MKVLLLENESPINDYLTQVIEDEEFYVYPAYDADMALEIIDKYEIDIAILDIMIGVTPSIEKHATRGGMYGGLILARFIRKKYPKIKLVACSAIDIFDFGNEVNDWFNKYGYGFVSKRNEDWIDNLIDYLNGIRSGCSKQAKSPKMKSKTNTSLFRNNTFGDNTTIMIGGANEINKITRIVKTNDIDSLLACLKEIGVSDIELPALNKSIIDDRGSTEHNNRKLGPKVSQWLDETLSKTASLAWDIEKGVAGSLIAAALMKYYGFL